MLKSLRLLSFNYCRKTILPAIIIMLFCGIGLSAEPVGKMNVPQILSEFDNANDSRQKELANRFYDILNGEEFFDEPYKMPAGWPADSVRAEFWLKASSYCFSTQQYKDAIKFGNKTLPLLSGDKLIDCLSTLSAACARTADYANAIKYGEEVLEIDRKTGDKSTISIDLSNLAFMYLSSDRPADARTYILEAIKNSSAVGDSLRMAVQMGIASEVFQDLKDNAKAIEYATKAYQIEMACGRQDRAAIRLCQLATAQMGAGKAAEARENLLKALPILEKAGNKQSYSIACNQLGSIALTDNQPAKAAEYFNKALSFFSQSGDFFNESKSRYGLYEALKQSNPRVAMAHLERLSVLKDSLYQREIRKTTSEFAAKYENEKLQEQQQQLHRNLEYEKRQLRSVIWSAAIILLLAACAILLLIRLNRMRRLRNDILSRQDRERTNFFNNITHEFRTPLTVIRGASDHALKHIGEADIITDDLHAIHRNEGNLLRLVNRLLDIAKLSKGAHTLPYKHGDVSGYLTMLCENCRMYGAERNVSVEYSAEPTEIPMDFVPEYIERIILNLVSNAVKFSKPGGSVQVHASAKGDNLVLTVHDEGVGMSKEQQKEIFKPFYQVNNGNYNAGSGLGLPLADLSSKAMGGSISVDSETGHGAIFTVTIPLKASVPVEEPFKMENYTPEQPELAATGTLSSAEDESDSEADVTRVLIVEDTPDVARYIAAQMNPTFSYYFAANGKEALAKAEELVPDLIITDVMMPEMDGFELTEQIRKSTIVDHVPVIMVTARATHDDRMKGLEAGADAYLEKPFHADELNVRAEKLMAQRAMMRRKFASVLAKTAGQDLPVITETEEVLDETPLTEREQRDKAFVDKFVVVVHKYMEKGKLNYDQIASEMSVGRAQLNRKLKAITGLTTKDYILQLRISQAKSLLLDTSLTVSEIAYRCGMDDPNYFSTLFRKATGMTPLAFRSQYQQTE